MKTPRASLQAARKARHWTQQRVAALIGVDRKTYNRWETGETDPHPFGIEQACLVFGMTAQELGLNDERDADQPQETEHHVLITPSFLPVTTMRIEEQPADWNVWISLKQLSILTMVYSQENTLGVREMQQTTTHTIRLIDHMLSHYQQQETQQLSRRQALASLAALPIAWSATPINHHLTKPFLAQCAAAVTTSWHLFKSGDFSAIEGLLPLYVPALAQLAIQSSAFQQEAARLAVLTKILQGSVAMHRLQFSVREQCCLEATTFAQYTRDPIIRGLAWMYLGYTYSFCPPLRLAMALEALQKGMALLEGQTTSLIYSDICLGLADVHAQLNHEKQALSYLQKAHTHFPINWEHDEYALYAECGLNTLYQWSGKTYLNLAQTHPSQGYQRHAWDAIDQSMSITPISDRSMTETIIYRADLARLLRDLDLYRTNIEQGAHMALEVGSRKRLSEVYHIFQQTPTAWLKDPQLQTIATDVFQQSPISGKR